MLHDSDGWLSSKTLFGDLELYMQAVEEFVPYIAAQLLTRQKARHSKELDRYFMEELDSEAEALRSQISGPLPRAIRGSALVVMYSVFEATALRYAESVARETNCLPFNSRAERGEFIPKITRYYWEILGIRLFSNRQENVGIDTLKELRHSFVHKHCSFSKLPKWLRAEIESKKTLLSSCHVNSEKWIPTTECINGYGQLIRIWEKALFERCIDRVGLATFL